MQTTPLKIKNNHSISVREAISKYRALMDRYDWDIKQSDISGGFLKAIKPSKTAWAVTAIYVLSVSCYENNRKASCTVKINSCDNDVNLSNCSPLSEEFINSKQSGSLKKFVKKLKSIK